MRRPTRTRPQFPKDSRSGIVRHSDTVVALADALERIPADPLVDVALEHDKTGVTYRRSWNRVAVCVALRKGSERYGIFLTGPRARAEGFGVITRHPTDPNLLVYVQTTDTEKWRSEHAEAVL